MKKRWMTGLVVLALAGTVALGPRVSGAATGQDNAAVQFGRLAVGEHGAVVSVDGHATRAGLEVLRAGGNAIDAAIAVGLALAVTHPQAGNLGGGGFMVIYLADEDRYTTLDFREMAPAVAHAEMYLGEDGRPVRGVNYVGWRAVGVPGTVAGFEKAHEWGRMDWADLVRPAQQLAADGFWVDPYLAGSFRRVAPTFQRYAGSAEAFLHPDGSPYAAGEKFVQPDLAWSLDQIATGGADAFYRGPIAERLVAAMEANDGLITAADLDNYRPVEREPVRGSYRGWDVISMGPPSSGGTTLVSMLNILENFDLEGADPTGAPLAHLMVESMRQAYMDRATHLGDADYHDVPVDWLVAKDRAVELAAAISPDTARKSADLGAAILTAPESPETTHYSVVDSFGNAVSTTYTIEAGFGSKVVAPGTGFLLNNEMGDFNEWPGMTDERGYVGTDPNLIAAGKRPLSSMTPTILARDGKPVALLGSPGGKTIINTVFRLVVNLVDFEMNLAQAVDAPRIHHQWMPDVVRLERAFPTGTADALMGMGHELGTGRIQGDAHCIWIYPDGARLAVADGRRSGSAAAY
ncbi:MAG: gamma-glutamyltransferase [Acidobacteria bacterium]|nr:gamma-glutamyltransferase [Acidobacteriota bacterium]